jgi:hypothetical protein
MIKNKVLRKEIIGLLLDFIIKYGEVFENRDSSEITIKECREFIESWVDDNL